MQINNTNCIKNKKNLYKNKKSGQNTFKQHFLRLKMTPTGYAGCHANGLVWGFPKRYNNSKSDPRVKSYAHLKFYRLSKVSLFTLD